MKILKRVISVLLTTSLLVSVATCLYNFIKIQSINYNYYKFETEEVDIKIEIKAYSNYVTSWDSSYENVEEYQKRYKNEMDFYEMIMECKDIYSFDYRVRLGCVDDISQIEFFGELEETEFEDLEGRSFTQEEIENGSKVAVINSAFAKKRNINVGDKYTFNYPHDGLTGTLVEVIGIYDINEDTNYTGRIYIPAKTLKEMSDIWLNEMVQIYKEDVFDYFRPAYINSSNILCKSEQKYDAVVDYIKEIRKQSDFKFNYVRKADPHFIIRDDLVVRGYERNLESTLPFLMVSLILFVIWFIYRKNNFDILEEKIEKELMVEKEKNVQDVFQMNQETHQLKHDMKHFLIQLSSLIENDEKEKGLQLIHEYYGDIESLELPVYTQNNTIDVLINHYSKKAKKLSIDFTYSGHLINELKVNERKLFILLSNALDNAFNHCDENKNVNMSLTYVEPYHRFVIMNTFDKKHEQSDNPEHGHGISSMKKIVSEMNGEILFEEKDNNYICTILIPVENN